jgi:pimeloyl-ACP methyl ester carboxylesterase
MELIVDDKRVFAATGGKNFDASKPVVVLIHGAGQDRTIWVLQTRYLAHHGFSVLAVDLPGHGQSEGPPLKTIEAMSDWVTRLLDAADVPHAHVVGHSMGAFVAMQCAAGHPERVLKAGFVSVSEAMPVHPELLAAAEANDMHAIELMNGWSLSSAGHRGGHKNPGTWMLGAGIRTVQRAAPDVLFVDFTACVARGSLLDAAVRIEAETLFLLGSADKMTPLESGEKVAAAVTNSVTVVLKKVGHALLLEAPDRVTATLESFLRD